MNRIVLTHLTFLGSDDTLPASVDFGSGLTVIHGASDTGKSFIVRSLDYMLGAKDLQLPDEGLSYTDCLLGLNLNGDHVTLQRSTNGGRFLLHEGEHRRLPASSTGVRLSWKHVAGSDKTLSSYLLQHLGLGGRRVRTNQTGRTQELSFRNLAHLTLIDETQMLSEVAPPLTSSFMQNTGEKSVLRLLLEDSDDSAVKDQASDRTAQRVGKGKIKLLERLIYDLELEESSTETPEELQRRLDLIQAQVERLTDSVSAISGERNRYFDSDTVSRAREADLQERLNSSQELQSRLGLLQAQYASDLRRLEAVSEVGSILGYFTPGVCVFCGAEPEHQHLAAHTFEESTRLGEAVASETARVRGLSNDLDQALLDLDRESESIARELRQVSEVRRGLLQEMRRIDAALEPLKAALPELVNGRARIERTLAIRDQIQRLEAAKIGVDVDDDTPSDFPVLAGPPLHRFVASLQDVLTDWHFPDQTPVDYEVETGEFVVGGRARSARGKGVRSVLHAAFTVGLAEHCLINELPHPGFVVLDSPFVTYKEPDGALVATESEGVPQSVGDAFYSYLESDFSGQAVVIENVGPPDHLSADTVVYQFTKNTHAGRYGFFPKETEEVFGTDRPALRGD